MSVERTLVLTKPETVKRAIIGEIITRFEKRGLKIIGMKMVWPDQDFVSKHYTEDLIEDWFKSRSLPREEGLKVVQRLRKHLTECPIIAMVLEGPHAIELVRKMIGSTSPHKAEIGTIRGDYTSDSYATADAHSEGRSIRNIIHASDSTENAEKEIYLWFNENEIFDYEHPLQKILYD